jgi:serine/threonine protein kinase
MDPDMQKLQQLSFMIKGIYHGTLVLSIKLQKRFKFSVVNYMGDETQLFMNGIRYESIKVLGRGKFATTFLCEAKDLNAKPKLVVLKRSNMIDKQE